MNYIRKIAGLALFCAQLLMSSVEEAETVVSLLCKQILLENQSEKESFPKNIEQLNESLKSKLEPILQSQTEQHHPGFKLKWSVDTRWASNIDTVYIPISFCTELINNDKICHDFWGHIGFLHHEITHIKKKHVDNRTRLAHKISDESLHEEFRKQEHEADDGVPNSILILNGFKKHFETKQSCCTDKHPCSAPDSTHPSCTERAKKLSQKLDRYLKQLNNT